MWSRCDGMNRFQAESQPCGSGEQHAELGAPVQAYGQTTPYGVSTSAARVTVHVASHPAALPAPMPTFAELLESLSRAADRPCQDFVTSVGVLRRSCSQVLDEARERGRQLLGLGLRPGDRVALMVTRPSDFLPLIHGCLLRGLVAVPMYPPPLFGDARYHADSVERILTAARTRTLIVDDGMSERLSSLPARTVTLSELSAVAGLGVTPAEAPQPEDLALLQFTSGSTSAPKGVRVTHAALVANAQAIMVDGLAAGSEDRGVSWLPLYHDMGLIGFGLAPLLTRTPVTFIPTARFVRRPSIWLSTISEVRATITFAPTFAYALTARRVAPGGLDLRSVRMWGCGAEPVAEVALAQFEQRFAACGVARGQISPCYGLAEATLAVTFTPPSAGRVGDTIDAELWEQRGLAQPSSGGRTMHFLSCGQVLRRHGLRIVAPDGTSLPERHAGEIVVTGPSLADGYENLPENTQATFHDGELHTGDQGYLADERLFVTGRLKDVVIVNGRNYAPQLIEEVTGGVDGVRCSIALNRAGEQGDELWLLVERQGRADRAVQEEVRARVAAALGVAVDGVVCLSPGKLPRTTSGKLRRSAARSLLPSGQGEAEGF